MNYKLFSIAYCFLVISSFVYSSSDSSDHSRRTSPYDKRVTFLSTDSVDGTKLLTSNYYSTNKARKVPCSQEILQNYNNETVVSPRKNSIQTATENESSETLIQTLQERIQEVEEKLKIKESVVVEQGRIIKSLEKTMLTKTEDHIKEKNDYIQEKHEAMSRIQQVYSDSTKQMISRLREDHRINMIVVATVSALSTWFVLSTKGSSESKP